MLAASSAISLVTALLPMEDLSTQLARHATNVVRLVISLAIAHKRLPMATSLVMLTLVPPWLPQSLQSHRFLSGLAMIR